MCLENSLESLPAPHDEHTEDVGDDVLEYDTDPASAEEIGTMIHTDPDTAVAAVEMLLECCSSDADGRLVSQVSA